MSTGSDCAAAAQQRGPPAWGAAILAAQRKMIVKPVLVHVAV